MDRFKRFGSSRMGPSFRDGKTKQEEEPYEITSLGEPQNASSATSGQDQVATRALNQLGGKDEQGSKRDDNLKQLGVSLSQFRVGEEETDSEEEDALAQDEKDNSEQLADRVAIDSVGYGLEGMGDGSRARLGKIGRGSHVGPAPLQVGLPKQIIRQVACGDTLSMALFANGQVYVWGNDNPQALLVKGFKKRVIQVACGKDHLCALTEEKSENLYTWGRNDYGQLGHNNRKALTHPVAVSTLPMGCRIVQVSCGAQFTVAISMKGNAYGFGRNDRSQLGLERQHENIGMSTPKRKENGAVLYPTRIAGLSKLIGIVELKSAENIKQYTRLMVECGSMHAVSWAAQQGRLMQAEQMQAFKSQNSRLGELEKQLHEAESRLSRIMSSRKMLENEEAKKFDKVQRDSNKDVLKDGTPAAAAAAAAAATTTTSTATAAVAIENTTSDSSVLNSKEKRWINKDGEVIELRYLSKELDNRAFVLESELAELEKKRQDNLADIVDTQAVIQNVDKSVLDIRNDMDKATLLLNQEHSSSSDRQHMRIQLAEWEAMAISGEDSVHQTVGHLGVAQARGSELNTAITKLENELQTSRRVRRVIENRREQRVKDLKKGFAETHVAQVHKFTRITRDALDALQHSSVEQLADEQKKETKNWRFNSTPPPPPGVFELIKMSNAKIDKIVKQTKERLVFDDAAVSLNDAGIEFVSAAFAAIQDSAEVRKSNNLYLSHLLGNSQQQLNQL